MCRFIAVLKDLRLLQKGFTSGFVYSNEVRGIAVLQGQFQENRDAHFNETPIDQEWIVTEGGVQLQTTSHAGAGSLNATEMDAMRMNTTCELCHHNGA